MGAVDLKVDGGLFAGIGDAVSGIINAVKGQIPPEKLAQIQLEEQKIQNSILIAQAEINKTEAASSSVFIAGARPALMWVFVLAYLLNYIVRPITQWILDVRGVGVTLPNLDMSEMVPVLVGMLGLGTMRSFEKFKGVQGKH